MSGALPDDVPATSEPGEAEVSVALPGLPFGDLPGPVRTRVLALVADVLPRVPGLSPALRKVAGFTAGRRARLGAAALAEALDDAERREAMAVHVAAAHEGTVRALEARRLPGGDEGQPDVDPLEAAALLWLTRPEGWSDHFDQVLAAATDERPGAEELVARLRQQVEALQHEARRQARDLRAEHRVKVDELRAENADLRRKLGQARKDLRAQDTGHDDALTGATRALETSETARSRAETELRRARARIEELERAAATTRQDERNQREDETLRARLLLDTLVDAAAGLRRELALPRTDTSPAERVAAALAPDPDAPGTSISSAARLEQHLAMPHVHVVLDGYNVTRSVWEGTSLETQRTRLLSLLPALAARTRAEVTVVFDAAAVTSRPVVAAPRGVRVLFSPTGVIADDVIRDLVAAEPTGRPLLVVTADAAVARDVRADGAVVVAPSAMLNLLARDLRS